MKDFVTVNYPTILLSLSSLYFSIYFYSSQKKIKNIETKFLKLYEDYQNLQKIFKNSNEFKSDNEFHKDNFIKFLSDSRDWAFEYIDDVQQGMNKFINEIEHEINYFDEFAIIDTVHPSYFSMKKISAEYKELKKLLPDKELK